MIPTAIKISKLDNPKSNTLAYCAITFDNEITIKDFRIVNGQKGMFLGFPSKPDPKSDPKDPKKKFYDTVYVEHLFNEDKSPGPGMEFKNKLEAWVLKKYREMVGAEKPAFEDQTKKGSGKGYSDEVPF